MRWPVVTSPGSWFISGLAVVVNVIGVDWYSPLMLTYPLFPHPSVCAPASEANAITPHSANEARYCRFMSVSPDYPEYGIRLRIPNSQFQIPNC